MAGKPKKSSQHGRDKTGRWLPGKSGNPAGRPRTNLYKAIETMTEEHASTIVDKIVEMVRSGDVTVIGTLLRHSLPKGRLLKLEGLEGDDPAASVLAAVGAGKISSEEGQAMARIVELVDHEKRLKAIEQKLGGLN